MNTVPRRRSTGILVAFSAGAILIAGYSIVSAQTTGAAPQAATTPAANTENGKRLFEAQACSSCHGDRGQGGLPNPEKEGAAPRVGPTRLSQPAFLAFVRNPIGRMPPYNTQNVSDAEIADLYAFLQSLAPSPKADAASANAQNGQRLFTTYGCYECHGNEGQGSTQTGGSRIESDAALRRQSRLRHRSRGHLCLPQVPARIHSRKEHSAPQPVVISLRGQFFTSSKFAAARIAVAPARPKW